MKNFNRLLLIIVITTIGNNAFAQRDTSKTNPNNRIYKPPVKTNNQVDTTRKLPVTHEETGNKDNTETGHHDRFIKLDTLKPVPVETKTFVRSVLRTNEIYPNKDAIEICKLLNPEVYKHSTTMSDYKLILPEFPEPDSKLKKSVKDEFKEQLKADANINNAYSVAARRLDTLANIFYAKDFTLTDDSASDHYQVIKNYLPALAQISGQAIGKIKRTSKKTVSTLTNETNILNKLLLEYNNAGELSAENVNGIHSLMADMNILLYVITGKKLNVEGLNQTGYSNNSLPYFMTASYSLTLPIERDESNYADDDDPRRFNIYIFRRGVVEATGERSPEMNTYTISYVIPALANDKDEWTTLPEPASTTSCYFAPARFQFSITDNRSGKVYSATADLYDAQKDPDEKWSIMNLLNPHPAYRLLFLIQ